MAFDPNQTYQQGSAPSGSAFPGSAPSGLSNAWENAVVIQDPPETKPSPGSEQFNFLNPPANTSKTIGQLLHEFDTAPSPAAQVDQLQSALWQGGFYGSGPPKFTPGQRDDATRTAFIRALKEASRAQTPLGQFLDARVTARQQAGIAGGAVSAKAPFVAEVTNPDDIKAVLRDTLKNKLGKGALPDDKLNAMVAAFQGQEQAAQQAEYNMTNTGAAGGTVVKPPDLATFADVQAHRTDPVAYDANKVLDQLGVINALFSGKQVAPSG